MNYRGTKFLIAMIALVVSAVGLFTDHLDGGTWVAALSVILGIYGATNVAQKKIK